MCGGHDSSGTGQVTASRYVCISYIETPYICEILCLYVYYMYIDSLTYSDIHSFLRSFVYSTVCIYIYIYSYRDMYIHIHIHASAHIVSSTDSTDSVGRHVYTKTERQVEQAVWAVLREGEGIRHGGDLSFCADG